MARVPALLLLACLLGFYLINVARADCYRCVDGDLGPLFAIAINPDYNYLDGAYIQSHKNCTTVEEITEKSPGDKCIQAYFIGKERGEYKHAILRNTASKAFLAKGWKVGSEVKPAEAPMIRYVVDSCEGHLCNKMPMEELEQLAKSTNRIGYTMIVFPVVACLITRIV
ncbi:unnamed protein product, partial [Mesorhabditis spiculigera]